MEYCINTLHSQGVTSVPKWGEGHPNEIAGSVQKQGADEDRQRSDSESSWASAEGTLQVPNCYLVFVVYQGVVCVVLCKCQYWCLWLNID